MLCCDLSLFLSLSLSLFISCSLTNSFADTLQKHQNVFTCCTAEGKDYPVQASTRDEMLMWIKVIEDVVVRAGLVIVTIATVMLM